jgi:Icc-related predicted phosphoesterase
MEKETRYGVISDVHGDPRVVPAAIEILKNKGVDKLIVNGDIGINHGTLKENQQYTAYILNSIGESGLESFVQPGSHEKWYIFGMLMNHFSNEYKNLIDATKNQKKDQGDHDLVFLPGTDFSCGGEFIIGNEFESGTYFNVEKGKGWVQFDKLENYVNDIGKSKLINWNFMRYKNINDLKDLITNPDKTIVVSHVPRKFDAEDCVDVAEFGDVTDDFYLNESLVQKGSVYPIVHARDINKAGYPVELKKENRGNEGLKKLFEELRITKAVSGHIHESGHKANDSYGNSVREGEFVKDLFLNAGCLSEGKTSILTVKGPKVCYENIDLKDYLK